MNQLKFKPLHPNAVLPERATKGSAGYDLCSIERVRIKPGCAETLRTGIAIELEPGYVAKAYSRSGHGFKHDVSLSNSVGIIDSDYRGEIMVRLRNEGLTVFEVAHGDKICQLVIQDVLTPEPVWTYELSETARGDGGFGSTD